MVDSDSNAAHELVKKIVEIHLELINGKVDMSHTHIEFWFSGDDFEGTRFYWFDDDGLTSVIHPDMAGLKDK